jgi:hypothetical protein
MMQQNNMNQPMMNNIPNPNNQIPGQPVGFVFGPQNNNQNTMQQQPINVIPTPQPVIPTPIMQEQNSFNGQPMMQQNNMNQPINNNVQNEMLDVPNNMNGGVNNANDFSNPMADFNPASVNTASPATAALMNNVNDIGSNSFDGGFGNGNMNNFTNNEMSQMVAPQEDTVKNKNKDKNDTSGTIKPSFIPPINE